MTRTAVVLGMAALGRPEPAPDCACATDIAGSSAISKGIMSLIELSFQLGCDRLIYRVPTYSIGSKKNYFSAKVLIKNFLASASLVARVGRSGLTRTIINTPAILGNSNLHFASLSSRVLPGKNGESRSR